MNNDQYQIVRKALEAAQSELRDWHCDHPTHKQIRDALAALDVAQPAAEQPIEPDNEKVICPHCAHQFRAIPVQVQQLMLGLGVEPPFAAAPAPASPLPAHMRRQIEQAIADSRKGMQLNDGKERVTLPGGTLARLLQIADAQPASPAKGEVVAWMVTTIAPEGQDPLVFLTKDQEQAQMYHESFARSIITPLCRCATTSKAEADSDAEGGELDPHIDGIVPIPMSEDEKAFFAKGRLHSSAQEPLQEQHPSGANEELFSQHWSVAGFVPEGVNPDHVYDAMRSAFYAGLAAAPSAAPAQQEPVAFAKSITFTQQLALDERQRLIERVSDLEAQLAAQPAAQRDAILPALPDPMERTEYNREGADFIFYYYSADQMQEYARRALAGKTAPEAGGQEGVLLAALSEIANSDPMHMQSSLRSIAQAAIDAYFATAPAQEAAPMSDEEILEQAHRMAWRYKHSSDPHHSHTYTFNDATMIVFVRRILGSAKNGEAG